MSGVFAVKHVGEVKKPKLAQKFKRQVFLPLDSTVLDLHLSQWNVAQVVVLVMLNCCWLYNLNTHPSNLPTIWNNIL